MIFFAMCFRVNWIPDVGKSAIVVLTVSIFVSPFQVVALRFRVWYEWCEHLPTTSTLVLDIDNFGEAKDQAPRTTRLWTVVIPEHRVMEPPRWSDGMMKMFPLLVREPTEEKHGPCHSHLSPK